MAAFEVLIIFYVNNMKLDSFKKNGKVDQNLPITVFPQENFASSFLFLKSG